jgi:diadenosine tetraphosphate (Ap4A) HIT family hydrolase
VPTIFSRIIAGDLPGTFVWRDEQCVVFLSVNPITTGHALVVPHEEVDHWIDLAPERAAHAFAVAHVVGQAQMAAFGCDRIGLIVAGYEVPHCHVHVIPTRSMADLSFANAAPSIERGELEAAAERIRVELRAMSRAEVV